MTPKELYRERITELTAEIKQLNKYNHLMVILELLAVALAVICVVFYTTWDGGIVSLIGAVLSIALYIAIRWKDSKNSRLSEEKESMRNVYQKELAYLHGDYSGFSSGELYINPHHEFTLDLDIFGPQSLFHRINRTVTSGGSDFLAKELAETRVRTKAEIEQRREAVCELAAKEPLRTAFLAATHGKHVNTSDVLKALSEIKAMHISHLAASKLSYVIAFGSFNAELLRLQQLIEVCRLNRHTLIILDEILKGTNSLDKLNGSRLFLQSVTSLPITGIIATHDLELSKMQQEHPERFHNYCFEIQLADEITYTYRLSEGVARNQNATYLLKNILKKHSLGLNFSR